MYIYLFIVHVQVYWLVSQNTLLLSVVAKFMQCNKNIACACYIAHVQGAWGISERRSF